MTTNTTPKVQFASDNNAGACPEALHWLGQANVTGHEPGYGDDYWTRRAADMLRDLFNYQCDVYFVFNGTAANSLALASMCQSYHSVICSPVAHIETDECGGPEFFSNGSKLLVTEGSTAEARLQRLEATCPTPHEHVGGERTPERQSIRGRRNLEIRS
ncbi:MAG: hypothetical protein D4S02_13145 [Rhodocyclaceae bacterium]|nr:MAG: hypothetical protein D4S02_13145 [Rhodocyclaceae bacterium]